MNELALKGYELPDDFESKKTALHFIPVEELINIIIEEFELEPNEALCRSNAQLIIGFLNDYLQEFSQVRDWRYLMTGTYFLESNNLAWELRAEKVNLDLELVLATEYISDYELEDKYPQGPIYMDDKYLTDDYLAWVWLEILESMLVEANMKIYQWNKVCSQQIPLIHKRPPFEEIKDKIIENVIEVVVEEMEYVGCGDLDYFVEREPIPLGFLTNSLEEIYFRFGPFAIELYQLCCRGAVFFQICITAPSVGLVFLVYDDIIRIEDEDFMTVLTTAENFINKIDDTLSKVEQNLIEWNMEVSK